MIQSKTKGMEKGVDGYKRDDEDVNRQKIVLGWDVTDRGFVDLSLICLYYNLLYNFHP